MVLLSVLTDCHYARSKFKSSLLLLRTIVVSLSAKQLCTDGRTTFERNNTSPAVAYTRLVGEVSSYHKITVAAFPVPLGPQIVSRLR